MTTLTIIRHGLSEGNRACAFHGRTDTPLAPQGEAQAASLGDALGRTAPRPVALYTSPLQRARQTAAAIGARLGMEPLIVPELSECDFGEVEGVAVRDVLRRDPMLFQRIRSGAFDDSFTFPGGESVAAFHARVRACLDELLAAHPVDPIIAVAHCWVIASGLAYLMTGSTSGANWMRYATSNTGVSRIQVEAGQPPRLLDFNRLDHLLAVAA